MWALQLPQLDTWIELPGRGSEKKNLGRARQYPQVEESRAEKFREDKATGIPKAVSELHTERELKNLKRVSSNS